MFADRTVLIIYLMVLIPTFCVQTRLITEMQALLIVGLGFVFSLTEM